MRRATGSVFLLVLGLALAGCGGPTKPATESAAPASATVTSASPEAPISVDEGLLTVDITVLRSLLDPDSEMTDEDIIQSAKDQGMTAVVNGDGTVTYTMSKAKQRELLESLRTSTAQTNAELVNNPDTSITDIEMNDQLSSFTVKVDRARYSDWDSFYVLVFYVAGGIYQQFAGVPADQVDVIVQFVDGATGEVLNTGSYREWAQRQAEQP